MSEDLEPARNKSLPIEVLRSPFARFAKMKAASGIVLLAGTIGALLWAMWFAKSSCLASKEFGSFVFAG